MTQVIRWEHVQNGNGLGLKNTYELMYGDKCVGAVWEKSSHSSYAIWGDPRGRYGVGHRSSLDEAKASAIERAVELGIIKSPRNEGN
jgi:hypothetical protein